MRPSKRTGARSKMVGFTSTRLIFILNVNGLNNPTEMQRLSDWVNRQGVTHVACKKPTLDTKLRTG